MGKIHKNYRDSVLYTSLQLAILSTDWFFWIATSNSWTFTLKEIKTHKHGIMSS